MRILILLIILCFADNLFAENAKRIVALSPHSVEMLFAIGAGEKIVGTVEYANYPKAALDIPRIGNYAGIQIEKLVTLEPDLIVAWKSGNKLADLKKLESLGLNLFYTHPKNISQIGDDLIKLGMRTGRDKESKVVADKIRQRYEAIKAQYKNEKKIKVFYQLWHDPLRTVGPKSWINSLISDCNGENLFNDSDSDYPVVSFESVLVKNPQAIIIPHHSGNVGAKSEIWNTWNTIDAVKNKDMTTINGDLLHRFGPRAIDGLAKLCAAIDQAR